MSSTMTYRTWRQTNTETIEASRTVCGRPLTGATTTVLSSSSSSSSLLSASSRSCCGERRRRRLLELSAFPSRFIVVLYLVWVGLIITATTATASSDLPRSRSRHHFRFMPRSVSPPQDTNTNTTPTTTTTTTSLYTTSSSTQSRSSSEAALDRGTAAPFKLPSVRSSSTQTLPPPTTTTTTTTTTTATTATRMRLRKILEGSDDEMLNSSVRRVQSRSQIETLHRHNTEVAVGIRVEPVPVSVFRQRLRSARSYRDVIRIFVRSEEPLRDEDLDDFISAPSPNSRQSVEDNSIPVNEWEMALNHLREMEEKGSCRQPVPKFIQVRHHELARPESNYVPACTVVYRCHKDYGCCNSTSECGVKTSTYIYRSFWELTCPPGSNCTRYNLPNVKTLRFVNHTECECKPVKQLPRCRLCPQPFDIYGREDFGRCNCSCDPSNQNCLEMENGRVPLETEQANCIRESNCERPHCRNGEYNNDLGTCPCPEDTPNCRHSSLSSEASEDVHTLTNEPQQSTEAYDQTTNEQHQTTNEQHQQTTDGQQEANEQQHRTTNGQQATDGQLATNTTETSDIQA